MVQRKVDLWDDLDKLPVCLCLQQERNKVDSVRCKREGVFRKGKVLSCHRLWKQVQYRRIDGLGIPNPKLCGAADCGRLFPVFRQTKSGYRSNRRR